MTFEKTKLSACPTPWTRSDPLSNEANWALVAGGLFFFIVCLLCLLRLQKEEENPLKGRKEGGSFSSKEALGYWVGGFIVHFQLLLWKIRYYLYGENSLSLVILGKPSKKKKCGFFKNTKTLRQISMYSGRMSVGGVWLKNNMCLNGLKWLKTHFKTMFVFYKKVWIWGWPPPPQCGKNPHFLFFFFFEGFPKKMTILIS